MDYLLAGSLGALIAFVFAIPAVILEMRKTGEAEHTEFIVEPRKILGRKLKHREAFLLGLLLHVLVGFVFGAVYILFVLREWLFVTRAPYTFLSLLVYAVLTWIVANVAIYPVLGMGLFARKEGQHVWVETIASHLVLGIALWFLIHYFQPQFFSM